MAEQGRGGTGRAMTRWPQHKAASACVWCPMIHAVRVSVFTCRCRCQPVLSLAATPPPPRP